MHEIIFCSPEIDSERCRNMIRFNPQFRTFPSYSYVQFSFSAIDDPNLPRFAFRCVEQTRERVSTLYREVLTVLISLIHLTQRSTYSPNRGERQSSPCSCS